MTPEQAIASLVLSISGLTTGKVLWESQNVARPALPYITLEATLLSDNTSLPDLRYIDNPDGEEGDPLADPPVIGTERLAVMSFQQDLSVRISYFAATSAAGAAYNPLDTLVKQLHLPGHRATLRASGVSFIEASPVQNIPEIVEAGFEGRSTAELLFRYIEQVSEATTYIEQVSEGTTYIDNCTGELTLDTTYNTDFDIDFTLEE